MGPSFGEDDKKKIEAASVQIIATGLEKGDIKQEQLPAIADHILNGLDALSTKEELIKFCRDLSSNWPIFKNLETINEGVVEDANETEASTQILKMAREGNIEQAIDLAKQTMENTHATANT